MHRRRSARRRQRTHARSSISWPRSASRARSVWIHPPCAWTKRRPAWHTSTCALPVPWSLRSGDACAALPWPSAVPNRPSRTPPPSRWLSPPIPGGVAAAVSCSAAFPSGRAQLACPSSARAWWTATIQHSPSSTARATLWRASAAVNLPLGDAWRTRSCSDSGCNPFRTGTGCGRGTHVVPMVGGGTREGRNTARRRFQWPGSQRLPPGADRSAPPPSALPARPSRAGGGNRSVGGVSCPQRRCARRA